MDKVVSTSVCGLLSMLKEGNPVLKQQALRNLNKFVDQFWPEISTSIPILKNLYEDDKCDQDQRQLAALLVSKVYYHLAEYDDSLSYALGAGSLFDISEDSNYTHALISKATDQYLRLKSKVPMSNAEFIDPTLEVIVGRMLDKCIQDGEYKQAVGTAIECRRLDKLVEAIERSGDVKITLQYCINACLSFVNNREHQHEVFRCLLKLRQDLFSRIQCLIFLDEPKAIARIMKTFLCATEEGTAMAAFQIAFLLVENDNLAFLLNVRKFLITCQPFPLAQSVIDQNGGIYAERLKKSSRILSGETSLALTLSFLKSQNKTDPLILKTIKQGVERSRGVCHSAIAYANAIMHSVLGIAQN